MTRSWLGNVAMATLFVALVGCSGSSGSASASGPVTATDPTKLTQGTGTIEVAAFKGGYGIDFYEAIAKEFEAKHPETKVKVEGGPRVWEQLRPKFVGGTPPDLCFPGWGMDHWTLAKEGQLVVLDDILKTEGADGKPWGETFEPSLLKLGQMDGKQYVLPYYVSVLGWWYDPAVFAKNGWSVPKTYSELLSLCEKIKAKGISPITYQGQYPYYMIDGMLLPWVLSIGGVEAITAAQNLEPGAWKSPAFIQAAKMIAELKAKGFFQKGATAMSHTEAQQEFVQGRAAMIPCGTWLYSEMKAVMPPTAKMDFMLPPVVEGGKGDPTALQVSIEPWMIPAKAKNQAGAVDLFKQMTSLENAKRFVKEKGTLMAIKGSSDGDAPAILKTPAAAFKASKQVWSVQYRQWYPAFETEMENAMTAMLEGQLTPEAFCDRVEAAAEKVRNDASIKKHKV